MKSSIWRALVASWRERSTLWGGIGGQEGLVEPMLVDSWTDSQRLDVVVIGFFTFVIDASVGALNEIMGDEVVNGRKAWSRAELAAEMLGTALES